MKNKLKQRKRTFYAVLLLILFVGIGFAILSTDLGILGSTKIYKNTWKVYVKDVSIEEGSVSASEAPIVEDGNTSTVALSYTVDLKELTTYYAFTFTVKNDSTLDIMLNGDPVVEGLNDDDKIYMYHLITMKEGDSIPRNLVIPAGGEEEFKIKVKYKEFITPEDLPKTQKQISIKTYLNFIQNDEQEHLTGAQLLINKANALEIQNYASGNVNEMYRYTQRELPQINEIMEYRYIGSSPYNFIDFNGETWRIIGVFPTDDGTGKIENRIKIIRWNALDTKRAYNSAQVDGVYSNDFEGSTIEVFLNGEYYDGLSTLAKSQIDNAKFYLGGTPYAVMFTGKEFFEFERGSTVQNPNRSLNIVRKVGLIYASDYVYGYSLGVEENGYKNNYIERHDSNDNYGYDNATNWLFGGIQNSGSITMTSDYFCDFICNSTFVIYNTSIVITMDPSFEHEVRPVVYLKADVKLTGTGSKGDHYKIVAE